MKIVYCLQGLHYSEGTERITTAKANYLVSHGIDVYIITTKTMIGNRSFHWTRG